MAAQKRFLGITVMSPYSQPGDGSEFNAAICESLDGLQEWFGLYIEGAPTIKQTEALLRHDGRKHTGGLRSTLIFSNSS